MPSQPAQSQQLPVDVVRFCSQFVRESRWVFVKTMPENPHEYTVRGRTSAEVDFVRFVELLREHGWDGKFAGRTYRYLDVDGYSYWTMGAPINRGDGSPLTVIVNRKPVDEVEGDHGRPDG